MSNITSIGVSGLDAATKRLGAAASNIANASTPGYTPVQAVSQATADGGVQTDIRASADDAGGVDLASEAVNVDQSVIGYKANAAVIRAADDMQRELLRDFHV